MRIYTFVYSLMMAASSLCFAEGQDTVKAEVNLSKNKPGVSVEVDCTKDPKNEKCTEKVSATVGPGGIALQVEQKTVTAVKEPPSESYNFSLLLGMMSGAGKGKSKNFGLFALNAELGFSALWGFGKHFPGPEGGTWDGMLFAPTVGFLSGLISFKGGYGEMTGSRIGGVIAYEHLSFGAMNPENFQQRGWGVQLGAYVGTQQMKMTTHTWMLTQYVTATSTSSDTSFGPSIGFVLPRYNAGTARLTSQEFRLMVLPTGDFTFVVLTGTWTF